MLILASGWATSPHQQDGGVLDGVDQEEQELSRQGIDPVQVVQEHDQAGVPGHPVQEGAQGHEELLPQLLWLHGGQLLGVALLGQDAAEDLQVRSDGTRVREPLGQLGPDLLSFLLAGVGVGEAEDILQQVGEERKGLAGRLG